jgi:hypothetical protein
LRVAAAVALVCVIAVAKSGVAVAVVLAVALVVRHINPVAGLPLDHQAAVVL